MCLRGVRSSGALCVSVSERRSWELVLVLRFLICFSLFASGCILTCVNLTAYGDECILCFCEFYYVTIDVTAGLLLLSTLLSLELRMPANR